MKNTLKLLKSSILLCSILGSMHIGLCQSTDAFTFSAPETWEQEEDHFVLHGAHHLKEKDHVWLFLMDSYGNYFMQYPAVRLKENAQWKAYNIRPSQKTREVIAVKVNHKGHDFLTKRVEARDFGGKPLDWVESLYGYKKVGEIAHRFSFEKPVNPPVIPIQKQDSLSITPLTDKSLTIATFERGSNPITLGGSLSKWQHAKELEVTVGFHRLTGKDSVHGRFAAAATFERKHKSPEWSGGGPVLTFYSNEAGVDVSSLSHLVFEIKATPGSQLDHLRVKLEDEYGGQRPERNLKDYGYFLSDGKWLTVKIPMREFASLRSGEAKHWEALNLTRVSKLVFVITDSAPTSGTFYLDNVRFE